MKKFVIISAILLLLSISAFGYSLYHYMEVNNLLDDILAATPDSAAAATEAPNADAKTDATQAKADADKTTEDSGDVFAAV